MNNDTLVSEYIKATNTHDFNNLIPLIDKTAIYQFTDRTCSGIQEIRAYFENTWELIQKEIYSATEVTLIISDEHTKVYCYNYHYKGYHNGNFISGHGKATNVFIDNGSNWVLKLEHLNSINN